MKKQALDATDIRILSTVQKHGQLSKARLAELVNLSATPCWARLTRLREAGYIRAYHADIALERVVDFTQVVVTVSLSQHRKADFERFERFVTQADPITDCVATGGGVDYILTVYAASLPAFQALMEEMLAAELGIDRYLIYIVTRRVKSGQPNLLSLVAQTG